MLFAFNGTGNKDEDNNDFDTNVTKIVEAYQGETFYQDGVGTGGWLDVAFGGLFGFGGKGRVKKAIEHLRKNNGYEISNDYIDIVGFSRGAALAIDFCNEIGNFGYKVRCLMLFDTVASFGLAGNNINLNYDLDTPSNTKHIFHAMSLDERRGLFPLTRLEGAEEMWFRGFHSDIGGGNGNYLLSNIPLTWISWMAKDSGVLLEGYTYPTFGGAECCKPKDIYPNDLREVKSTDKVHKSVIHREFVADGFPGNNPSQILDN